MGLLRALIILGGPMLDKQSVADHQDEHPKQKKKFSYVASRETYTEPEPILDPTCGFEEMDRGEGMGVHDERTYSRTEK